MSNVIHIHDSRAARSKGVALAVACAANRLGLTPEQVIRCAQAAADRMKSGKASGARIVADAKAEIASSLPAATA